MNGPVNKNFKANDLITFKEREEISDSFFGGERRLYSQVVFEWIREWSPELKQAILADGLVVNRSSDEAVSEIKQLNPIVLLSVLIDQNNAKLLLEWIDFSFGDDETRDTDTMVFNSKMTQGMVDFLNSSKRLFPDTKEVLLNHLAR